MIANVDNVVTWLQKNNLQYWQVLTKDADNSKVFESDESGFDSNAKRFLDVMELTKGSRFFIKAATAKGVNRGNFSDEFRNITDQQPSAQPTQSSAITGVPQDEVQRQIDAAIAGYDTKLKMQALEAECKELKQQVKDHDNMTSRVLQKIEPYLGTLISTVASKFLPQTTPIAMSGVEYQQDETNPENTDTQNAEHETENTEQTRLMIALEKWSKADPDFISLIESVATLAATGDPMYAMAKNLLKNK